MQFDLEIEPRAPQFVTSDEGKLRQVVINLVGNAVKFTEQGGIVLAATGGQDGKSLRVEVRDTGPGVSPEEQKRLFKSFEQTSTGIRAGGTGLGLAISRVFIRLMGGEIHVESEVGKGSAFWLRYRSRRRPQLGPETGRKALRRRVGKLAPGRAGLANPGR